MNDVQLSVLPTSNSEEETKNIGLFLLLEFFDILVGTHVGSEGFCVEIRCWPGTIGGPANAASCFLREEVDLSPWDCPFGGYAL